MVGRISKQTNKRAEIIGSTKWLNTNSGERQAIPNTTDLKPVKYFQNYAVLLPRSAVVPVRCVIVGMTVDWNE